MNLLIDVETYNICPLVIFIYMFWFLFALGFLVFSYKADLKIFNLEEVFFNILWIMSTDSSVWFSLW
jgi:hypothetical protein